MDKEKCTACNKKLDKDNYKKDRTDCEECYDRKKRKYKKFQRNYQHMMFA